MATRFRLRELLDEREMTQTELHLRTRLAYSTINDLYHNKARGVELDTLDAICAALNCSVADVLEYTAERKRSR